jgi:glyoxylase-like metal-dependent hydrolase (beta-lactamase superfamily II)
MSPGDGSGRPTRRDGAGLVLAGLLLLAGCGAPMVHGVAGAMAATPGPGSSMFTVFDTDAGMVVVDLGWWRAAHELEATLAAAGAVPEHVVAVLLTHAHRDHVAAWPAVRTAVFHMGAPEEPYFFGEAEYAGWIPRIADRLVEPPHPGRDEVAVVSLPADTTLVFGRDTVHAFLVPGHTPGSVAYLVRGIVFAGDALAHTPFGFRHALSGYSDDVGQSEASLRSLFQRLEGHDVRLMCTAHGRCSPFTEDFRRDALGEPPSPTGR